MAEAHQHYSARRLVGLHPSAPPVPDKLSLDPKARQCLTGYRALEEAARNNGVSDARHQRVDDFPFLRRSRFLASFNTQKLSGPAYYQWLAHHNALAVEGLMMEWKRLPSDQQEQLHQHWPIDKMALQRELEECGAVLVSYQSEQPHLTQVVAENSYQQWKRWVGLYPLTALPFYRGVINEQAIHREHQRVFFDQVDPDSAPDTDHWTSYSAPTSSPVEALQALRQQPLNALGIPQLDSATQDRRPRAPPCSACPTKL